jgi:hypothetical protein
LRREGPLAQDRVVKRRALWALAVAALAGGLLWATRPSPRRPRQDPRFLTLGELAADLARDPKTFDAVLERIGAGRTSVGLVGDTQRAVMRRLFESADYAGLDRQPRVTLEMLRAGLDLLAQRRTGQAPPVEPTADPCGASKPSPDAAAAEPLGIPTGAIPRGVQELAPLGLDLFLGERVDPRKSARYCDSARLADLLEWLATDEGARRGVAVGAGVAHSPEELVRALAGATASRFATSGSSPTSATSSGAACRWPPRCGCAPAARTFPSRTPRSRCPSTDPMCARRRRSTTRSTLGARAAGVRDTVRISRAIPPGWAAASHTATRATAPSRPCG